MAIETDFDSFGLLDSLSITRTEVASLLCSNLESTSDPREAKTRLRVSGLPRESTTFCRLVISLEIERGDAWRLGGVDLRRRVPPDAAADGGENADVEDDTWVSLKSQNSVASHILDVTP